MDNSGWGWAGPGVDPLVGAVAGRVCPELTGWGQACAQPCWRRTPEGAAPAQVCGGGPLRGVRSQFPAGGDAGPDGVFPPPLLLGAWVIRVTLLPGGTWEPGPGVLYMIVAFGSCEPSGATV